MWNKAVTPVLLQLIVVLNALCCFLSWLRHDALRHVLHWNETKPQVSGKGHSPAPPRTVGVVFAEADTHRINTDLAVHLACWCLDANIPYVYLYDPHGILVDAAADIKAKLTHIVGTITLQVGMQKDQAGSCNVKTLGIEKEQPPTIHLLSSKDSLSPIIEAALTNPTQQGEPIYQQLAAVAGAAVLRPPDLLMVCGPVLTLAGYPPYHTRSCEIYHLGACKDVSHHAFHRCLQRYTSTLQRFGA